MLSTCSWKTTSLALSGPPLAVIVKAVLVPLTTRSNSNVLLYLVTVNPVTLNASIFVLRSP